MLPILMGEVLWLGVTCSHFPGKKVGKRTQVKRKTSYCKSKRVTLGVSAKLYNF